MIDNSGRGGQPPKICPVTEGGWEVDLAVEKINLDSDLAGLVIEALESVGAPQNLTLYSQALGIMRNYRLQFQFLNNPRTSADKNKNTKGIGRFKNDLKRRSEKMAAQLDAALSDEASYHLDSLIQEGELRSHMKAAYDSLIAIADLIERAQDGVVPMSAAEIRNDAGSKLKALARKNGLPMMAFVAAFGIYPKVGNGIHEQDAFNKWYQRLEG
ncbi:hypothetical protein [Roseinatronobacter bogoriensis]|uniref:Uncharacterized protein n=1 Tax=Roseinatronobacter bogoriensis subsp. barguzinensis TaxID=441209 RepID=A0A2K8KD94_9RHOB|nr:hypothetical protein [Rhodobaca]ATX66946.1 hypothetical protein BG454_14900 [Rhodobaca barguzinensis]MBB4206437.1 hypothetical protein [Rhodobaca bogoriensis DSM 18756]TDW41181.1 hypothetical protein LY39_00282 [Rhodobaca barguzinensis]TDY74641.1 hypothetical protein EV660_101682 [Rhodobaca bogoriensis DSM 18756]